VRDALAWSKYIDEALELFGADAEVAFAQHNWPRWGNEVVRDFLRIQRDAYRYIHDQTMRLANQGETMLEIAEALELPESLAAHFHVRSYYGTVSHNAKAVYQRYLGWFDGNPAHLHALPPVEAGRRYVDYMGGAAAVLGKARKAFDEGDYRWVAEVVNHVVFAEPDNAEARELQAQALEQLGYQAESGIWRNFYLTGAMELRQGSPAGRLTSQAGARGVIAAVPAGMLFDALAVRLNGPRAAGKKIKVNLDFTDTGEQFVLRVEHGTLSWAAGRQDADADAALRLPRTVLDAMAVSAPGKAGEALAKGDLQISGRRPEALAELFGLLDAFASNFDIVTP